MHLYISIFGGNICVVGENYWSFLQVVYKLLSEKFIRFQDNVLSSALS